MKKWLIALLVPFMISISSLSVFAEEAEGEGDPAAVTEEAGTEAAPEEAPVVEGGGEEVTE